MNETQAFIYKLDELLYRYNQLLTVNYEKEFLRYIEVQESKRREMAAALEDAHSKIKIAKAKLKFETKKRRKAESECEKLVETLKLLNTDRTEHTATFQTARSVSPIFTCLEENDLDEVNFRAQTLRKHSSDESSINLSKSETWKTSGMINSCPVSKIRSFELLSLGVSRLEENTYKKRNYEKHDNTYTISTKASKCDQMDATSEDEIKEEINVKRFLLSTSKKNITPRNHKYFDSLIENSDFKNFDNNLELANVKSETENISKYAPFIPPMIPSIVVRCINEIEQRGLKEIGIYRMAGIEEEIHHINQTFHKCEQFELTSFSVHSICSYLKNFLRDVSLIPTIHHDSFTKIIYDHNKDPLYQAISKLPQPNRDTLAYLIVHLRRVINTETCRMTLHRISSVFGPIIFGLTNSDKENQLLESRTISVVEELLMLPSGYWNSFIVIPSPDTPSKFRKSPSTERIIRNKAKKYFSPVTRRKKFFTTPIIDNN